VLAPREHGAYGQLLFPLVSALLIVYLGILPTRVLDWAASSISAIF